MKFYKILTDNEFIGIINSNNFVMENSTNGWLFTSNENLGQYVSYENKLYRDYWMQPIPNNNFTYVNVSIIEIDEEEYNTLQKAIDNNETIIIDDDDDEIIPETPIEDPDITVEYVRNSKIQEMSAICHTVIEKGFDLTLRNKNYHFSLDTQDQLNLISLSAMAQTQELIPYHADGEVCIFYTAEEINLIVETATQFKIYHTTYYNALKTYINALETIEEISAITYGTPIPEEYKSDVLRALEQ